MKREWCSFTKVYAFLFFCIAICCSPARAEITSATEYQTAIVQQPKVSPEWIELNKKYLSTTRNASNKTVWTSAVSFYTHQIETSDGVRKGLFLKFRGTLEIAPESINTFEQALALIPASEDKILQEQRHDLLIKIGAAYWREYLRSLRKKKFRQKAEEYFLQALHESEQYFDANSREIEIACNWASFACVDPQEKIKYLLRSLEIVEHREGKKSEKYAQKCKNMATRYKDIGDIATAKIYWEKALAVPVPLLREAENYKSFSNFCKTIEDYSTAHEYAEKALNTRMQSPDGNTIATVRFFDNVADIYHAEKKSKDALLWLQKGDQFLKKFPAENLSKIEQRVFSYNLALHYCVYATNFHLKKQYPQALDVLRKADELFVKLNWKKKSDLYFRFARTYRAMKNFPEAEKYFLKMLESLPKRDQENAEHARGYREYAFFCRDICRYDEAEKWGKTALLIDKRMYGEYHSDVANDCNLLGLISDEKANYDQAEKYYRDGLRIIQKIKGENAVRCGAFLNNLAIVKGNMADYLTQVEFYKKTLEIYRKNNRTKTRNYALTLGNLGNSYIRLGNWELAEKISKDALNLKLQLLGENDDLTASSFTNLAKLYLELGDHEKAQEMILKGISIREKILGDKHDRTAFSYNLMGEIMLRMNRYEDAQKYFQKAMHTYTQNLGPDHPSFAGVLSNLGELYSKKGDISQSLSYYDQALSIRRKNHQELHPAFADILVLKGDVLIQQKNEDEALNVYRKALHIYESKYSTTHPKTQKLYQKIAEFHQKKGNFEEAQRYYTRMHKTEENISLNTLWSPASKGDNNEKLLHQYYLALKNSLQKHSKADVLATMRSLLRLHGNANSVEQELLQNFDALEEKLRDSEQSLPEYFLFLDNFTESGFSGIFAEQRKNYFGNLEEIAEELSDSPDLQLTALTILTTDYLLDRNYFKDGKDKSQQAVSLAEKDKKYDAALKIYQHTLRQLLCFSDDDFPVLQEKAVRLAEKAGKKDFSTIFYLQKLLYEFKITRNPATANVIVQILAANPAIAAEEVYSFIKGNTAFFNSGSTSVIKMLKALPPDADIQVSQEMRRRIAILLENAGYHSEALKWFPQQLTAIDRLLYLNAASINDKPETVRKNMTQLLELKPEPFKMENMEYSTEDMDLLLSVTKCRYAKLLADDSLLLSSARHAEDLMESGVCDRLFTKTLQNETDQVLCDLYYMTGDFQAAREKIEDILERIESTDSRYAWYQHQLGLCCLALQKNKPAVDAFQLAAKLFVQQKKKNMAKSAYRNLACALYRCKKYTQAQEAILLSRNAGNDFTAGKENGSQEVDSGIIIELATLQNDPQYTNKEKTQKFLQLWKRVPKIDSPVILCDFLLASAVFRNELVRQPIISIQINDLEGYFKYKDSIAKEEWLRTPSFLPNGEVMARKMLFSALRKQNDVAKLDYWNKKFEQHRVRSMSVSSSSDDNDKEENVSDLALLDLIEQFQSAKAIVEEELRKPEGERDKKLLQSATSTRRRLETLFEMKKRQLSKEKQAKFTALAADTFVIPADALSQLASALEPGTVCLQFIPMDDEILVYLVTHNAPPVLQTVSLKKYILTGAKFQKQLQKLRVLLQSNSSPETKVKKELKKVYDILIADLIPALDKLGTKKLLVNSMGVLRYIPFAALYDGKQYLVEKYQITNATGLDMVRLSKAAASREMDKVKAVVFANPDGSLPSAQKEGENVASLFQKKQVFVGPQATIGELEALAGNVNFLHLATHGVIDAEHPRKSFILLANGTKWRYCDMMGFNIENVDSIVLSACNSAVSEKATGGEIEGMAYQLLRKSPSGSVLASLWKVDDKATSVLMDVYYKHMTDSITQKHLLDRGGALREAQLKLLKNRETAKPYYWAAFTLFGDCR